VAAAGLVLGTAAAWLVGWVAGLGQPNRLLLALLFLVVAVVAAAAWAMAFIGREPRDRDAHEIAVARRLSERGVMLEQQADAESRLAAIGVAWDAAGDEVRGIQERAAEAMDAGLTSPISSG
jgi:membrane protein implicated in regulation of membrane protease activity